jgi:hypothetical protein
LGKAYLINDKYALLAHRSMSQYLKELKIGMIWPKNPVEWVRINLLVLNHFWDFCVRVFTGILEFHETIAVEIV